MGTMNPFDGRIVRNPGILGGKPIIQGTRLSVEWVLDELHLGATAEEWVRNHPYLAVEDIEAAVAYAEVHHVGRPGAKPKTW